MRGGDGAQGKKLAFLAFATERCPDELMADFLQTYRIDVWGVDWASICDGDVGRYAALAYQLPHTSRTWMVFEPTLVNDTADYLLRRIELNQRVWQWAHTKDAEHKVNEPAPLTLPGEAERNEERERKAEVDAASVAAAFGI